MHNGFPPAPKGAALDEDTAVKIICIGLNYGGHIREQGMEPPLEPLLFAKFETTLIGPGEAIVLPPEATHVDSEAELAVEIGRRGRRIPEDDALDFVAGYRCANDVSARNLQYGDKQWTRGKGFDTFCPVGPVVSDEVDPEAGLTQGMTLETRVNGELRQQGSTLDFIFRIPELLVYITSFMTLEPGDLVLTGTPSGVGPLAAGDRVDVSISGLGVLANTVESSTD